MILLIIMLISNLDFKKDLKEIFKKCIKNLENLSPNFNFHDQVKDKNDINQLCLLYLNLKNRLVEPKEREVHKSDMLYCPVRFRGSFREIERMIKNGEDINSHLSRLVRFVEDPSSRDRHRDILLDLWGIKHIHLGTQIERDGFVERTGPILFSKFDEKNTYFLLIKRHGREGNRYHDPWNNQILIDIIHRNWPDTIKNYKATVKANKATDDEIKKWKKGNINTIATAKDGTLYFPPGGGLTMSGDNIQHVRVCFHILRVIDNFEGWLRENVTNFLESLKCYGKSTNKPLHFQLLSLEFVGENLKVMVLEKNSEACVEFKEGSEPKLHIKKD